MNTTTIKINGLDVEFSEKVPTKAGVYWWVDGPDNVAGEEAFAVVEGGRSLWVIGIGRTSDLKGFWSTSPLVPAVEVERAYKEGWLMANGHSIPDPPEYWEEEYKPSRAKRVVEGTLE